MGIMIVAMRAKIVLAHLYVNAEYICCVKRGKVVAVVLPVAPNGWFCQSSIWKNGHDSDSRQSACPARADDANGP